MPEEKMKSEEEIYRDVVRNAEERVLLARFRKFDDVDRAIILIKMEQMAEVTERKK